MATGQDDDSIDIRARLGHARESVREKKYEEATVEFLWLWDNMLTYRPASAGVRLSFMIGDMQSTARASEYAREEFTKLRDRYAQAVHSCQAAGRQLVDWMHLNMALDDSNATIQWYDAARRRGASLGDLRGLAEHQLFELLLERERWKDAGELLEDPLRTLSEFISILEHMRERWEKRRDEPSRSAVDHEERSMRATGVKLYAACLAAGRDSEADEIRRLMYTQHRSPRLPIELIEMALQAREPREIHLTWLEKVAERSEATEQLRSRLEKALRHT